MEPLRDNESIIQFGHNMVKIPNWCKRQSSWLFTGVAGDLNSGLPRTNPAKIQTLGPHCLAHKHIRKRMAKKPSPFYVASLSATPFKTKVGLTLSLLRVPNVKIHENSKNYYFFVKY